MSLTSFIHDVTSGIGDALGNLVHGIGGAVKGLYNDIKRGLKNKVVDAVLLAVASYYGYGAFAAAAEGGGGGGGGASAAGGASGGISGILGGLSSGVQDVASFLNSYIKPITGVITQFKDLFQQINDQVIAPVSNLVTATHNDIHSLVTAFHTDLQGGLRGLVKLPGDIANALGSLDAVYQRSTQELGATQSGIVKDTLVPGLNEGIGKPLEGMHKTFSAPVFSEDDQAAFEQLYKINERDQYDEIVKAMLGFENAAENAAGFWGPLVKAIWGVLKAGTLAVEQVEVQAEIVKQYSRYGTPVELLSPGEAVEAVRRGLISYDDYSTELQKQGLDKTRQTLLYNLAQFLFGPRDAVNLRNRGIIDDKVFNELMDQNNLDPGQADALRQLMSHILGPGDIIGAFARGYIDDKLREKMLQYANVTPEIGSIIQELELSLVDPKLMIAMHGRQQVTEHGWLGGALNQPAPGLIQDQFYRAQTEQGTADLNWLAHWRIPGPEWWVSLWFRGVRTRTEVEQAFEANNVPPEIWPDIFANEEELPPVWLVPDIVASGVWSEEQAVPQLMKLGFSQENAKVLYDYGYSKSKSSKATTAADLQKLSLGNAKSLFDDGIITDTQYHQVLLDHGYSADAAKLTVELAQFELYTKERKDAAQGIVDQANLGQLTEAQAQAQLYDLGFTTAEVDKWLLKLHQAKAAKAKLPSRSELDKLLKKQLITKEEWLVTMEALGYSQNWALLLIELV